MAGKRNQAVLPQVPDAGRRGDPGEGRAAVEPAVSCRKPSASPRRPSRPNGGVPEFVGAAAATGVRRWRWFWASSGLGVDARRRAHLDPSYAGRPCWQTRDLGAGAARLCATFEALDSDGGRGCGLMLAALIRPPGAHVRDRPGRLMPDQRGMGFRWRVCEAAPLVLSAGFCRGWPVRSPCGTTRDRWPGSPPSCWTWACRWSTSRRQRLSWVRPSRGSEGRSRPPGRGPGSACLAMPCRSCPDPSTRLHRWSGGILGSHAGRQPSDRTLQAGVLADDHDDVGQHQREQVAVLQHGRQLSCRVATQGVDNQMDTSVDERVHHLDGAMQSLQFGGRRAATAPMASIVAGTGGPIWGSESSPSGTGGELVQPVLLGGVEAPRRHGQPPELQADQAGVRFPSGRLRSGPAARSRARSPNDRRPGRWSSVGTTCSSRLEAVQADHRRRPRRRRVPAAVPRRLVCAVFWAGGRLGVHWGTGFGR